MQRSSRIVAPYLSRQYFSASSGVNRRDLKMPRARTTWRCHWIVRLLRPVRLAIVAADGQARLYPVLEPSRSRMASRVALISSGSCRLARILRSAQFRRAAFSRDILLYPCRGIEHGAGGPCTATVRQPLVDPFFGTVCCVFQIRASSPSLPGYPACSGQGSRFVCP